MFFGSSSAILAQGISISYNRRLLLTLFHEQPPGSSRPHFERFIKENVLQRLRRADERARRQGLASMDPAEDPIIGLGMEIDAGGRVTKNSLGVFHLSWQAESHPEWADRAAHEAEDILQCAKEIHDTPLRFLIWAGMGGSIEDKLMYQTVGLLRRGLRFYALDSTDPGKLKAILADMQRRCRQPLPDVLRSTLVVGMAMGMTSYEPVVNLQKLAALYERHRVDSRPNFIYLTLPGSLLDQFASPRGYRRIPLQFDEEHTTAGRHSSPLTRGSLIPLALAGVNLRDWIEATSLTEEEIHTAWSLSAFIHAQGEAGRDKLTLLLPKAWRGAGLWTKQDFEESLGKCDLCGLKIVIEERPKAANYRPVRDPRQDRVFLAVEIEEEPHPDAASIKSLRRSSYPLATLTFPAPARLSRYMQFMHYAVFGVAYLRKMNFVTQPSVELYKAIANRLHEDARSAGGIDKTQAWMAMVRSLRQSRWRGAIALHYDGLPLDPPDKDAEAPEVYGWLLRQLFERREVEYGELTFFGDTRYSAQGRALRKVLDRGGERLFRNRYRMPVDIYEGPAMNHSYHEMIIGHGRCFSTVLLCEKQEQIAAAGYRADYHVAQFLATRLALVERRRPVVALLLKDTGERTLRLLEEFFHRAGRA
jgi:glucose-6-phosphate isomerase